MTTNYLDDFLYIVAIDKRFVSKKIINIEKNKQHRLEVWDPFGYLLF